MKHTIKRRQSLPSIGQTQAYTLIEIMVTTLCVLAIATLLLPILSSSRDTAKMAVCTMNMKQIYNGMVTQSIKNGDGILPPDPYQWEFYAESLVESDVMICPMETNGNHFKIDDGFKFLPAPPPNLLEGTEESDDHVIVFRERAAFRVPETFKYISKPGIYGRGVEADIGPDIFCRHTPDAYMPVGELVDVYYFSYDPYSSANQGAEGQIWFGTNDNVLGYVGTHNDLNITDEIVGLDGYDYPQDLGCRGVDHCGSGKYADAVEITEHRRSIGHKFAHASTTCKDDFRVFVSPGSGSSYAMNVEVKQKPSNDHQILLADAHVPWVNFTDGVDSHDFTYDEAIAPRHFGKVNILTVQGSVSLVDPADLLPDSLLWRE